MTKSPPGPVVLHSSPVRVLLAVTTPVILLTVGVTWLSAQVSLLTVTMTALGAALAVVVLFDLPLRSEFDAEGVTRVCILRRQRLPWSRVIAVERATGRPSRRRGEHRDDRPSARRAQGLTARLGRRRVSILVDRRESLREYHAISALLRPRVTVLRASAPPVDSVPAGRGRRSLHRTDQAGPSHR